jgi:hypothetical protein
MESVVQFAYLLPVYDPRDVIRVVWSAYSLTYFLIATVVFAIKILDGSLIIPLFQYCHRLTFLVVAYTVLYTLIHILDSMFSAGENTDILWKIHSELKKGRKQPKEKVKDI